jgi:hypothetical protein
MALLRRIFWFNQSGLAFGSAANYWVMALGIWFTPSGNCVDMDHVVKKMDLFFDRA